MIFYLKILHPGCYKCNPFNTHFVISTDRTIKDGIIRVTQSSTNHRNVTSITIQSWHSKILCLCTRVYSKTESYIIASIVAYFRGYA